MSGDAYASAVIDTLAGDFPGLRDPSTAATVWEFVHDNVRDGHLIEVIVDSPFTANWRLIPAPHDRRRVHLACCKQRRSDADAERWTRLNAALDTLDPDMEEQQ